jgi:hypothetical protein
MSGPDSPMPPGKPTRLVFLRYYLKEYLFIWNAAANYKGGQDGA